MLWFIDLLFMQDLEEVKKNFQLSVGELKKIYKQLKVAINKQKQHLDCIYFNRIDGELVATDSKQMLIYKYLSIKLENATENDNLLLFTSIIKDILKNNKDDDNIIDFIKNEQGGRYTIKINDRCYKNNEHNYSFPRYKVIIGDNKNIGVLNLNCNVFDFSKYKDRIIKFCEKATSLKTASEKLELYCDNSTKLYLIHQADELIMYDTIELTEAQNINFSFDIKMFLNVIQDNKNSLCCFDKMYYFNNSSPFLAKKDDVLYLLMPFVDGVSEDRKKFVKDKNNNNIDEVVLKIEKQKNKEILQKDFDLQRTSYYAPSKNFIRNYEKARNFFKVKDTMEEIYNKRKRRQISAYDKDIYSDSNIYCTQSKRKRKLEDIKEHRIVNNTGVKQFDYVWFEKKTTWDQFKILKDIFENKIKNITEISNIDLEHYTKILTTCKQQKYLSSWQKYLLEDFENKFSSLAIKESGEKQEIEQKQEQQIQQQAEIDKQEDQQTDIEKKIAICSCYFTRAKYSEKNKRFQNETGHFDKIQYTIKNGCLSVYRPRTGELLEHSIKADDLVYNNEKKKWIYTRKREGGQRLRIDFDKNIFDLINGKPERMKKGILIEFATQAIKKIEKWQCFNSSFIESFMSKIELKNKNVLYIYKNKDEQEQQGSKCYFNVLDNEILFEIRDKNDELLGFRIYKQDIDVDELKRQLIKSGYFNKEIDRNFEYLCD